MQYDAAYAIDRQQGIIQDFTLALDDRDIAQMLPIRADYFHYGVRVICLLGLSAF